MDAFIQIITDNEAEFTDDHINGVYDILGNKYADTKLPSLVALTESNQSVLYVPLKKHTNDKNSDVYAERIGHFLNNSGIKDFTLEMSTGIPVSQLTEGSFPEEPVQEKPETRDIFTQTDYDVVNDLIVFMRNNYKFYSTYYYPALHNVAKKYRKTKQLDIEKYMMPVVKQAARMYCSVYNTPESHTELFGDQEIKSVLDRIRREETPEIQNREY